MYSVSDRSAAIALFSPDDDYFVDVTRRLPSLGVPVGFIVTKAPESFGDQFPSDLLVNARRFIDPTAILSLNDGDPGCLSSAEREEFTALQGLYLTITDRLAHFPTTVRFRTQLFRALLRYWIRFFDDRPHIKATFHTSAPHMGWDTVAFHVAKSRGLKTLFLQRSLMTNRVMLWEDYSSVERVPAEFLAQETLESIRAELQPGLWALVNDASPWSRHSATINRNIVANARDPWPKLPRVSVFGIPAGLVRAFNRLRGPSDRSETSMLQVETPIPQYRLELERRRYKGHVTVLRDAYQALSRPPGTAPFFVFALHLQPERSTCPQGGFYDDQLFAVETAAKALPPGHELYVKEHPRQFSLKTLKSLHYRDVDFYQRMAALPGVRLMPIETDTQSLIEGALGVITITGSAGWEGLLAGKPCLAFGVPWYAANRSCHSVRSLEDCRAAFSACLHSNPTRVERDLVTFLAYIQGGLIHATSNALFARGAPEFDLLVKNLATAIAERIKQSSATPS
jgi:hypothetical protein